MPLYPATLHEDQICLPVELMVRANYIVFPHYTPFTTICGQCPYMAHTVYGLSPSGRKTCTILKVNGALLLAVDL